MYVPNVPIKPDYKVKNKNLKKMKFQISKTLNDVTKSNKSHIYFQAVIRATNRG